MEVAPAVSQSTEVPVEPPTVFRPYTAEINRRLVCSWRQADWRPGTSWRSRWPSSRRAPAPW